MFILEQSKSKLALRIESWFCDYCESPAVRADLLLMFMLYQILHNDSTISMVLPKMLYHDTLILTLILSFWQLVLSIFFIRFWPRNMKKKKVCLLVCLPDCLSVGLSVWFSFLVFKCQYVSCLWSNWAVLWIRYSCESLLSYL